MNVLIRFDLFLFDFILDQSQTICFFWIFWDISQPSFWPLSSFFLAVCILIWTPLSPPALLPVLPFVGGMFTMRRSELRLPVRPMSSELWRILSSSLNSIFEIVSLRPICELRIINRFESSAIYNKLCVIESKSACSECQVYFISSAGISGRSSFHRVPRI